MLVTGANFVSKMGMAQKTLHTNYADWARRSGALCVLYLPCDDPAALADQFDILLLTGGEDINPFIYNLECIPQCGKIDDERDREELALLDEFVKRKKPVIGVCRGLQIINVYFGGTLYQDLPSQVGVDHSGGLFHKIVTVPETELGKQLTDGATVNSYHHQSVLSLGEGLEIAAYSEDGVVEAIAHTSLPIAAVQWHPERLEDVEVSFQRMFELMLKREGIE